MSSFDDFVDEYGPGDELERARFKKALSDLVEMELREDLVDDIDWEPLDREHDRSIETIREVYHDPKPGTWHSESRGFIDVQDMADGHLLNVARRILFGPIDVRRQGLELKHESACRRVAAFPWIFYELIHRGLRYSDYACAVCRDIADNFNPRTYPTEDEPSHPDCHVCQNDPLDDAHVRR